MGTSQIGGGASGGAAIRRELDWIRRNMPLTRWAAGRLPDMSGVRLACNMHLDAKMITFIDAVLEAGAKVHLTTCNTDTVNDDLVAIARERGADAVAHRGMPRDVWGRSLAAALEWEPTHLCEMGAELTSALYGTNPLLQGRRLRDEGRGERIRAGMEATGSGITRLQELRQREELAYPIWNWDDIPVKEGLHNRHMVGITAWHTFFERTGLTLHGKRVVVVGYGSVGRGVADAARAYGGHVVVAEPEPGRALEASFAGYPVGVLPEVAEGADVVVTATGHPQVVAMDTVRRLNAGAFLLNVGHLAHEIDTEALSPFRSEELLPHVREYRVDGRSVYLLAEGSMVNLAAGRGDSINAFDVTLAVMTATVGHMVVTSRRGATASPGEAQDPGVHTVPAAVWRGAVSPDVRSADSAIT